MKFRLITLTLLLFLTTIYGCSGDKEPEPFNVQGVKTTIHRILISPLAFDGATVAVTGYVDKNSFELSKNELILADKINNKITVNFENDYTPVADDFILVSGKFVKNLTKIENAEIYKIIIEDDTIKPLNN